MHTHTCPHHTYADLIKVDGESCLCGFHGIIQLPQTSQGVGHLHEPHITMYTWTYVDGLALTLNGLARITHNAPVQTAQVEEDS